MSATEETVTESASKYKSWLDGSHPLLERFKLLAPASFKHCQNVASMADAVANELPEVDRELLKVAAIFHDVGKVMNPDHFIENQNGSDNPHDDLDPHVSYHLITRHVSDSAALLAQHHCSPEVIDIVLQHHGSTVVKYFYRVSKAKDDEAYRYKWDAPQSVEAAILLVTDVVEAAARSMHESGKLDALEGGRAEFVENFVKDLEEDGQLDNIRVRVLKAIKRVLPRELDALFHKRIDYPEEERPSSDG